MKTSDKNKNLSAIDSQSKTFFTRGKFNWKKRETDVWAEMETLIENQSKPGRSISINFKRTIYAIAASLLLLIGITSFLRFFTTTVISPAGEHQLAVLPDGSTIDLNAESMIKYNPYWWRYNRSLTFEGEAYFKVEKGKKFTVNSTLGTTQVLGTSFNIFSRNDIYKVTCLTGSVKVTSSSKHEAILKPNSKAEIKSNGEIEVEKDIDTFSEISWKKNIFLFTATPVREVFYEIERQYAINIEAHIDSYVLYTGNFTKEQNVEEILNYVCPALGFQFSKKSDKEYIISQENE